MVVTSSELERTSEEIIRWLWDFRLSLLWIWRWLSSVMLSRVAWYKFTRVSDVFTIYIIRAMMKAVNTPKHRSISTKLHGTTLRKIIAFILEDSHLYPRRQPPLSQKTVTFIPEDSHLCPRRQSHLSQNTVTFIPEDSHFYPWRQSPLSLKTVTFIPEDSHLYLRRQSPLSLKTVTVIPEDSRLYPRRY
jgi:hypothetical protein